MAFKRIIFNPDVMGGQACIRNLCIPVATIVKLIATEMTVEEILRNTPF